MQTPVSSVADWLATLGLSGYAGCFADNDIDISVLHHLTDQDLRELGVSLGHRRKMLAAIAELVGAAPVTSQLAASPESKRPEEAERRQLSVMFCDLVGSTKLSTRLDPEDLRAVIGAYHRCCTELIEQKGGFVAKYMGDGVLAYFGYPRAHEHDAERAVQAGLALVEAVPGLDTAVGSREKHIVSLLEAVKREQRNLNISAGKEFDRVAASRSTQTLHVASCSRRAYHRERRRQMDHAITDTPADIILHGALELSKNS